MVYLCIVGKKSRLYIAQEHSVAEEGRNVKDGTRGSRAGTIGVVAFFSVSVIISISVIAFSIVFFFSEVRGSSMMATLNPHYTIARPANTDGVLVNRHLTARRGNIIVVEFYDETRTLFEGGAPRAYFIKRLIAIGGDTVYFERIPLETPNQAGMAYRFEIQVNGIPVNEHYLDTHWGQNLIYGFVWNKINGLPHNEPNVRDYSYFIRETHYPHGVYTRWRNEHGGLDVNNPVPTRVNSRFEIHIPHGYIFYMGDNRGGEGSVADWRLRSWDSSYFGPKRASTIMGVVVDIVSDNQSLPLYILDRLWHFVSFRFLWG